MNTKIKKNALSQALDQGDVPYLIIDTPDLDPVGLYQRVLAERAHFAPSQVILRNSNVGYLPDSRNSLTLMNKPLVTELSNLVNELVGREHQNIIDKLSIADFKKGPMFFSCIVFQDGNFFKAHRDYDPKIIAKRKYTWVYYFHREPKKFSGGNLVFYSKGRRIAEIEPYSGLLVAFRSDIVHEVERVSVPSLDFADGRFTLTGFVCESPTFLRRVMLKLRRIWLKIPFVVSLEQLIIRMSRTLYRAIRLRLSGRSVKFSPPRG